MPDITPNVVVSMPSQLFTMPREFKSVFNGMIYIGEVDTDPTIQSNQIQVYVENEDGSYTPMPQPIRTNAGGYPVYNGKVSKFVTEKNHCMLIQDANGVQLFYFPNILKYDPDQFIGTVLQKFDTLSDLIAGPTQVGHMYETLGYYQIADGGSARYFMSQTAGSIPELAYQCSNGLYAILQHNGTISLEQLGAKGQPVDTGVQPTDDSWDAFYKAYKIKKTSLYGLSLRFITTKSTYYCSKPVLLCTGMVIENDGSPWITRIIYGGGKVTESEVPTTAGLYPNDAPIVYSDISAACIAVHNTNLYCNYATIRGFKFVRANGLPSLGFGIYSPYASKLTVKDVRVEGAYVGLYSRDIWGSVIDGTIFLGLDTNTPPVSGSAGIKVEPYLGVDAFEAGGTSNTYRAVGTSGFQIGFKITRQSYSTFESCYSEKGNDVAIEMHGSDGISFTGFGLENLTNTSFGAIRFYNTRASIDSLTFQYNCQISSGAIMRFVGPSKINIQNISFGRVINSGTSIQLFNIDSTSQVQLGNLDIPASLIASTGYSFGTVSGKLVSDYAFSSTIGIANGNGTTNAVTFTTNEIMFRYGLNMIDFTIRAEWTGGSGSEMQVFNLPRVFEKNTIVTAFLPSSNAPVYGLGLQGTNRVRIVSQNASFMPITATGTIYLSGQYSYL